MSAPSFPVLRSADAFSVSPAALAAASHPLTALAGGLRSAGPAFAAAWAGAAHVLAAQHTGQALAACQSGVVSGLAGCASSMEALGRMLRKNQNPQIRGRTKSPGHLL